MGSVACKVKTYSQTHCDCQQCFFHVFQFFCLSYIVKIQLIFECSKLFQFNFDLFIRIIGYSVNIVFTSNEDIFSLFNNKTTVPFFNVCFFMLLCFCIYFLYVLLRKNVSLLYKIIYLFSQASNGYVCFVVKYWERVKRFWDSFDSSNVSIPKIPRSKTYNNAIMSVKPAKLSPFELSTSKYLHAMINYVLKYDTYEHLIMLSSIYIV